MSVIATIFGAPWLGHGRRLEAALALICFLFGMCLAVDPKIALNTPATFDLYWQGYGRIIAVPFLLTAVSSGLGVIANIRAWPYSRCLRQSGALVGSFIWWGMIWKYAEFGSIFSFGSVCAMVFLVSSIGIMAMASAGLPKPGAPGAL